MVGREGRRASAVVEGGERHKNGTGWNGEQKRARPTKASTMLLGIATQRQLRRQEW